MTTSRPRPNVTYGGSAFPPVPGGLSQSEAREAEQLLAGLLPPFDPGATSAVLAVALRRLILAAGLTTASAGAILSGPVLAVACAAGIAGWICLAVSQLLAQARTGRSARLADAAAIHAAALPGRVPGATLAVARRHLQAIARRRGRAWLYIARCTGPDAPCTAYCTGAATMPLGRQVLVILGEHLACRPLAAAAALAHEAGHYTNPWLRQAHFARTTTGWGWAAAGMAGALAGGWPGAAIAGGLFWAASLLALWAGEVGCDLRAARSEGYPATAAGFMYMAGLSAGRRPGAVAVLNWVAGPVHPPLRLRRTIARSSARHEGHGHGHGRKAIR